MARKLLKVIGLTGLLLLNDVALAEKYEIVGNFLTSGKIISRETANGKKFAVKDKKGKIRTSFDYDWIMPVLQSPTGILASKNHKLGTLNPKTFQPEIPFIYDQIGGFNATQDLVVAVKENRAGVITAKNQIVIPFDYYRIALNFKEIENYSEQVSIATPIKSDENFLLINTHNQILATIARPKNFANYFVNDFDSQLIALSDDYNNAVLMDWNGKVILNNKLGKPILNYKSVMFTDYKTHETVTMSYTIDDKGGYHFKTEAVSSMTIQ